MHLKNIFTIYRETETSFGKFDPKGLKFVPSFYDKCGLKYKRE